MVCDRSDSFPFEFEPNRNRFGLKSKGTLSPRSYPIQYERKWILSEILSGNDEINKSLLCMVKTFRTTLS